MHIIITILSTVVGIIALLLIGLILIQQSKGGGFGTAFGGAGESVFGAQAGSHITKLTVIFISVFMILTLVLAIITGHREMPQSIVEKDAAITVPASKKTVPGKISGLENLEKRLKVVPKQDKRSAPKTKSSIP